VQPGWLIEDDHGVAARRLGGAAFTSNVQLPRWISATARCEREVGGGAAGVRGAAARSVAIPAVGDLTSEVGFVLAVAPYAALPRRAA
jgi:hypothetical protein